MKMKYFRYRNTDLRIDNDGYEAVISKIETEEDDITIVHELIDANGKVLHERKSLEDSLKEEILKFLQFKEDQRTNSFRKHRAKLFAQLAAATILKCAISASSGNYQKNPDVKKSSPECEVNSFS
ncbi:hypothetical protein HHI36_022615 [Cryptolaemus montrouzieri]|uniref:Uncharacterized protein n=1 Tax=Cryptolaemus montrouzieri TaxID=559131 RepID=A0ABD2N086_9CUCU